MTKHQLEGYRKKLLQLGHRLEADIRPLNDEGLRPAGAEASGSFSNVPLHMADLGSDQFTLETDLGLLENESRLLEEVHEALLRFEDGTFGRCQECGKAIGRERLEAIPYASQCITCARQAEQT